MVLQVKLAFLFLYTNNSFIKDYHEFILKYIEKSGYKNIEVICIKGKKHKLPTVPNFKLTKELKENILGSQYFIN